MATRIIDAPELYHKLCELKNVDTLYLTFTPLDDIDLVAAVERYKELVSKYDFTIDVEIVCINTYLLKAVELFNVKNVKMKGVANYV